MFMGLPRQSVALSLIFLLAGHQVHVVNAMRGEDAALQALERSFDIPESDAGCQKKGMMGKGKCVPEQYCEYKKAWGGLKRSCRLKAPFRPDEDLATKFGTHAGSLLEKSEAFRSKGSLKAFYKMKKHMEAVGVCQSASDSDEPEPKLLLKGSMAAFGSKSVEDFASFLEEQKKSLPELAVFGTGAFAAEALKATALERMVENLQEGSKQSKVLSAAMADVDLKELIKIRSSDGPPSKESLAKVFPKASPEALDEALKEAQGVEAELQQKCSGDDQCLRQAKAQAESEHVQRLAAEAGSEEQVTEALLQKLEALGHGDIRVHGNPEASHAALLEFLEGNLQHLEGDLESRELVMRVQGFFGALIILAAIIGLSFACGPALGWCMGIGIVSFIVIGSMKHSAKKRRKEYDAMIAANASAEEDGEGEDAEGGDAAGEASE